jgi:hypothetical protein
MHERSWAVGEGQNKTPPLSAADDNPFAAMGMVKFWILSTLFYLLFPASLIICFVAFGPRRTKQLVHALIDDFLMTILILLVVLALFIWAAFHFLTPLFGG